jgi:hypothetical protein
MSDIVINNNTNNAVSITMEDNTYSMGAQDEECYPIDFSKQTTMTIVYADASCIFHLPTGGDIGPDPTYISGDPMDKQGCNKIISIRNDPNSFSIQSYSCTTSFLLNIL